MYCCVGCHARFSIFYGDSVVYSGPFSIFVTQCLYSVFLLRNIYSGLVCPQCVVVLVGMLAFSIFYGDSVAYSGPFSIFISMR